MSTPPTAPASVPRRYTSGVLTAGVALSALCFVIAALAEMAGVEAGSGDMTDIGAIVDGLRGLDPWAWATLGVYVVVLTPAAGLVATIGEFGSVGERRTTLMALSVLAILTISAVVAIGIPLAR